MLKAESPFLIVDPQSCPYGEAGPEPAKAADQAACMEPDIIPAESADQTGQAGNEERKFTGKIEFLRSGEIEEALSHNSRQYFTGELKLPQHLRFLRDLNIESGISNYPCYKWEQPHYHTVTSEYCYLLSGETKYVDLACGKEYHFCEGDFYVLRRDVPYLQKCMAGCRLFFLKAPGINDKVVLPMDERMYAWCWDWELAWGSAAGTER